MTRTVFSFAFIGFALAGTASATTKTTPALSKVAADWFNCRVLNANATPTAVELQILNAAGTAVVSTSLVLPGGATGSINYTGTDQIAYCRVEGSFSRKRTLVTFCALVGGTSECKVAVGDPGL